MPAEDHAALSSPGAAGNRRVHLEKFQAAWQRGEVPSIEDHLCDEGSARLALLRELIACDLECRWRRAASADTADFTPQGANRVAAAQPASRWRLEDYHRRHPQLGPWQDIPLELVLAEYRARRSWGDSPSHDEFLTRFPAIGQRLKAALVDADRELAAEVAPLGRAGESVHAFSTTQDGAPLATNATPLDSAFASGVVAGRYQLLGELGSGGFGVVYRAYDPELNREVAIKVPRPGVLSSEVAATQFQQEARAAARLKHPAIVTVHDVLRQPDGACLVVMEYVAGRSLESVLKNERPTTKSAVDLLVALADAVHYAHMQGLVHRDLKPANILLDEAGHPHITDFGLALHETDQRRHAGEISGTPAYMAPEQARGEAHRLDGRADLWSLGVIFYEMLTGRRPFTGENAGQVFDEIKHREPKPPRQVDDSIPEALERICLKCLNKPVTGRYTTGADLAIDLRRALEGCTLQDVATSIPPASQVAATAPSAATDAPPSTQIRSNFTAPTTSFVGRQRELAEVTELLRDRAGWLLTLSGPGGIGKTRFALEVGRSLVDQFEGGCWLADLTEAKTPADVATAVAQAFNVPLVGSESPEEAVGHILQYRRPLLLILDNFEQVVEYAPQTVVYWRQRAPRVRFLVTSRVLLGLAGEREYELGTLPTPPTEGDNTPAATDVAAYDAVRLFCDRAQDAQQSFAMDATNASAIARICRDLEGIPLAIELAAARVKVLKPAQIAERLGQRFQLLRSQRRDVSPRQQTLQSAIDWSFDLLNDWEQSAFLQASVFRGGFFLGAAEQVIDLSAYAAPPVMDVLQSLREKSLLRVKDLAYEARYSLYLSLRDYGQLKLAAADAGLQASLTDRFWQATVDYAEAWERRIHARDAVEALDRIELETDNLFAVIDGALAAGQPDAAVRAMLALAETLAVRGPANQRVPRIQRVVAAASQAAPALQVRLLAALSEARQATGDWDGATQAADQAVTTAKQLCPGAPLAAALRQQGEMHRLQGDFDGAVQSLAAAETLYRQLEDRAGLAATLASRGIMRWLRGEFDGALDCYAEAEAIVRPQGDQRTIAGIARSRGHVLWQRGQYQAALACYAEAESISRQLRDRRSIHLAVGNRANVLSDLGDYAGALRCYAEAESIARQLGDRRGIAVNVGNRGIVLHRQGDFDGALRCYADAERINRELGNQGGIALNVADRGEALAALGQCEAALACLAEAEAINRRLKHNSAIAHNRGQQGIVLLTLSRAADAHAALRESLSIYDEIGKVGTHEYFEFQAAFAAAEKALNHPDQAREVAEKARRLAVELGISTDHPLAAIRAAMARLTDVLGA